MPTLADYGRRPEESSGDSIERVLTSLASTGPTELPALFAVSDLHVGDFLSALAQMKILGLVEIDETGASGSVALSSSGQTLASKLPNSDWLLRSKR